MNNPTRQDTTVTSDGSLKPEIMSTFERKSPNPERKTKRVYVIDDEVYIADTLVEILNDSGYEARAFYNGKAAIDVAMQKSPDIVISDVMMPGLNGVETALLIRGLCPDTHIILFSGQAGALNLLDHARAKGNEFELLLKPIHPDDLLERLSELK